MKVGKSYLLFGLLICLGVTRGQVEQSLIHQPKFTPGLTASESGPDQLPERSPSVNPNSYSLQTAGSQSNQRLAGKTLPESNLPFVHQYSTQDTLPSLGQFSREWASKEGFSLTAAPRLHFRSSPSIDLSDHPRRLTQARAAEGWFHKRHPAESDSDDNPLKRIPPELFVRRAPHYTHSFVGKRHLGSSELAERALAEYYRTSYADTLDDFDKFYHPGGFYVNQIDESPERTPGNYNGAPSSIQTEKRPRFGHSFVGKRNDYFGPSATEKRVRKFGHTFVGKRFKEGQVWVEKRPRFGHTFIGKRSQGTFVTESPGSGFTS